MTSAGRPHADHLRCIEFVDIATAYLDGALDESDVRCVEDHLEGCQGCRAALEQVRTVIRVAGELSPADVASMDPLIRDMLLSTFRVPRRR
jgi:predicted anti-sigma-YlaC factor YlaD